MEEKLKKILFPHSKIRKAQDRLIEAVEEAISEKKNLIVHAPTGLGKTAAVLSPALAYAIKNKKSVFFLTSRHTQHVIAIETLQKIKEKHGAKIISIDIIGKKWMCLQEGVDGLYSNDFSEYCKALREDKKCDFYSNIREKGKLSIEAQRVLSELKDRSPMHIEKVVEVCKKSGVCPYEMSVKLAKDANVVIADYYYVFNPSIRDSFFSKTKKELRDCIIIVDEGHNLPLRIRDLASVRLTNFMLERAIKEAKKFKLSESLRFLEMVYEVLRNLSRKLELNSEKIIKKDEFVELIRLSNDYDEVISELIFAGDEVRETQKQSYIGSIGSFLEEWVGEDKGFARIISKKESKGKNFIMLSYRCLDPSVIASDVLNNSHSTILMSGTLTPTSMYGDVLGFEDVIEKEFENPFPEQNKLSLIIPETTTKFTMRNDAQFKEIGKRIRDIVNKVPGNCAAFFPSYYLRDQVYKNIYEKTNKKIILEEPGLNKEEKNDIFKKIKKYKKSGVLLLGTASGSFGEGIDLPGDLLKCVIVVGLPLQPPDLETKELIRYYDDKFSKGWDYGYIFPAFIKSLQNAGRCIRSEKDRGVIIFLDERYAWANYYRLFPKDMNVKISKMYLKRVEGFFKKP